MRHGELRVWTERWDDTPVIGAEGEIDLGTVELFRTLVSEVVRTKPEAIIFDLRQVKFIDSSGLAVLVATRKRLGTGADVSVVTEQLAVLQSLNVTGLDRVVRVLHEPAPAVSGSVKSYFRLGR